MPHKVTSPNLQKQPARDLSIYMQTEALKNILHDNYKHDFLRSINSNLDHEDESAIGMSPVINTKLMKKKSRISTGLLSGA